jgi:hypothetical protein
MEMFRSLFLLVLRRFLNGLVMLIIVGGFGCKSQSSDQSIERDALLSIWHSKAISAKARAGAANKWIPAGTDGEVVRNLLGSPPEGWHRFHGPSLNVNGKPGPAFDFWELIYPCSDNGSVALCFNQVTNTSDFHVLFDHAFVYEASLSH